jgi:hypothetical protein
VKDSRLSTRHRIVQRFNPLKNFGPRARTGGRCFSQTGGPGREHFNS